MTPREADLRSERPTPREAEWRTRLRHACCGLDDFAYDAERVASLLARLNRMADEIGTPESIRWSPDVHHQRTNGEWVGTIPRLRKVPTQCDPALPPNSIVFMGADLAAAEAPRA